MRPTSILRSDMPGPKTYSAWWGDKNNGFKQKGVVTYSLSPFRQRAAKGMFSGYIMNGYRRLSGEFIYWSIPFALGYSVYAWAKSYDAWQGSKEGHLALAAHSEEEH